MTMKKAMNHAKEMPNLRGIEEDLFYVGECLCRTATTYRDESIARVRASEAYRSASHVGVFMSQADVATQEKWERILLSLESLTIPMNKMFNK